MLHSIELDTLHHILMQCSKDILNDCSQIICKLLNSLSDTITLEDLGTLKSVNVLLHLYEKIHMNNNETKVTFPTDLILKNIKKAILHSDDDDCGLDNKIQLEILSILHCLFKILYVENSSEAMEELSKFYNYCLNCIYATTAEKGCRQDHLIFRLKVVQTVYNLLRDSTCTINLAHFFEKSRSNNFDEDKVFTKLALHGDDDVAIYTLMLLIPAYTDCLKTENNIIFPVVWKEISESVTNSSVNYSRVMLILCSFFEKYFSETTATKEYYLTFLLNDVNYWHLIQSVLVRNDPKLRKQGMFLFKKTVEVLHSTSGKGKETIVCSKDGIIFYWDLNLKDKLYKTYSEIITILEFLDEQQVHIIRPVFGQAERLLQTIIECNEMSQDWFFLVCHKALIHDNIEVVRWGLGNLLTFSTETFSKTDKQVKEYINKFCALLLLTLKNPALYYSYSYRLDVKNSLMSFFERMSRSYVSFEACDTDCDSYFLGEFVVVDDKFRFLLCSFIKQVCSSVWSPEALFFVMHYLHCWLKEGGVRVWGEDEILQIRTFVMKAFKTYHKTIATGIQCMLLRVIENLMDYRRVPLKSFLLLLSSFPLLRSPSRESPLWRDIVCMLNINSDIDVEEILHLYKRPEVGKEFNAQSMSLTLILLHCGCQNFFDIKSDLVVEWLSEILLLFKGIDRRPYCQRSLYDQYLSVVSHIYEANVNDPDRTMLKRSLPLMEEVKLYIRSQLKQMSELQDFSTSKLYLNAFENIIKVQKLFKVGSEEISNTCADVLNDLKTYLHSKSENSSVGLYCKIQFLNVLLKLHPTEVKEDFLASYLLTEVNTHLEKKENHQEHTKDIQTLWGRMNSEFIEAKWAILAYLINNELIVSGPDKPEAENAISHDDLVRLCMEGLDIGGYGVLHPVMSVLKSELPTMINCSQVAEIIASVWKLMMERRKTEEFKFFVKDFVEMLYQRPFILKGESVEKILIEYADKIFTDPSLVMIIALMRHIQSIDLAGCSESLFCHIIGKALVFGSVQRRDEKLTTTVCRLIDKLWICPVWEESCGTGLKKDNKKPCMSGPGRVGKPPEYWWRDKLSDHLTSNEVRARAVERVLALRKDSQRDEAIAEKLVNILMKIYGEVGNGRERYFGDSYIHRVKHRVMQALLLLEPLCRALEVRRDLCVWLRDCLLMANAQPSVRYQQEWLFIRILIKDRHYQCLLQRALSDFDKIKARSLCSLMVVQYHMWHLLPESSPGAIYFLVPFLLHQHFDVRLHAQLFISYYYYRGKIQGGEREWDILGMALSEADKVMIKQRVKNYLKLQEDFFLKTFNPREHYSLETIYFELPRLVKVDSDEWISTKLLEYCGVDPSKIEIPLTNTDLSLRSYYDEMKYLSLLVTDKSEAQELILENYQKKIIPNNYWSWNKELGAFQGLMKEKDGLVVVASLIDRLPNLGGLARTCEIFGVSEYVINSLKCTEDKQFTSLSVTAEKWMPLKEVKAHNLMKYILEMKQNGYTVVGAEQALHSEPLSSVILPKKTLLILGNEKEGISPDLLPLLDICVEIPQMGIIRSLNVHVTGALFIWEYAKQHNISNFVCNK